MFYLIIKLIKHVQVQDQMEVQKLCISLCSTVEKKKRVMALIWRKYPLSWPCLLFSVYRVNKQQHKHEYVQLCQFRPKKRGNEQKDFFF